MILLQTKIQKCYNIESSNSQENDFDKATIADLSEIEQRLFEGEKNAAKIKGQELDPQILEEHIQAHKIKLMALASLVHNKKPRNYDKFIK